MKTESFITKKGLDNSSAKLIPVNSIIVAMYGQGDTAGRVAINKIPLATNQACCNLIIDQDKADFNFIYYLLCDSYEELVLKKTGSAQPNLNTTLVKALDILLPSLTEQQAIASVLTSLDDKIDLLNRENKTLESMAETLFRQWFIEDVNDATTTIGEYAQNIRENIKTENLSQYSNYVGLEHIPRKSITLTTWGNTDELGSNKSVFNKGDILFGKLRSYFHKVVFAPIDGVCSTDVLVIRPKQPEWFAFCLFWFFNEDLVEYSDLGSGGTRMPRTNWEIISSYEIPQPNMERIEKFNTFANPLMEKMTENITQIHQLEKVRNNLLPKLMSGELLLHA